MPIGLIALVLGYVLSQFYRAFLAVLSPVLDAEIGAGPEDLAMASGLWFVTFAAMQIPVGWALDHIGPRRTASGCRPRRARRPEFPQATTFFSASSSGRSPSFRGPP